MIVDNDGRFITGRTVPGLVLLHAIPHPKGLLLKADGQPDLLVHPPNNSGPKRSVTVWGDQLTVPWVPTASAWLHRTLNTPAHLVTMPDEVLRPVDPDFAKANEIVSFADGFPLLLIGEASLADLNKRLDTPVTMAHFRPNLVITGCDPYAEDHWREIQIGDVRLSLVKRCARCIFTTVDPATGTRNASGEPLRTLKTYRRSEDGKVMFGQNALPRSVGTLCINDPITVLSSH